LGPIPILLKKGEINMGFKPIHDRIVIQPTNSDTVTATGIVIPDAAQEKPQKGKVIAAGPGRKNTEGMLVPIEVKEGDIVLYNRYGGQTVKINNVEYIIMKEDDVLAIID
jgi:chaperonin GroES